MKLTVGCILYLLFMIPFEIASSVQIDEKSNIKNDIKRFEPTWESLDSRELPKWYKRVVYMTG